MKNGSDLIVLHIDFDKYTDGDVDFKRELISLMVADILELYRCIVNAFTLNDSDILHKGCHKANTTLEMINDRELTTVINELKEKMANAEINGTAVSEDEILSLSKLFNELAKSIGCLNESN